MDEAKKGGGVMVALIFGGLVFFFADFLTVIIANLTETVFLSCKIRHF